MANKQSALKELRKTKKRTINNARIKTNVKHLYKECLELLKQGKTEEAKVKAKEFQQASDKAAKRHVISQNRAKRKNSALMLMISGKKQSNPKTLKTPKSETEETTKEA
ncbi:MAG: 30S ribosomal protein S20 [Patescibacteria group bacterium]